MSKSLTLRTLAATCAATIALAGAAACTSERDGADPDRVNVVAAFYPLQFVAERVGGNAVTVTNLAKPGAEPHDLELNPQQVGQVSQAELIVYLKGFQPAIDDAVAQEGGDRAFDVATVAPLRDAAADEHEDDHAQEDDHAHEHGADGKDPHVWLDPTRLAAISDRLAARLAEINPDRAADYTARAATLRADLAKLDQEYTQGLQTCQRREIVVSHAAFGYLADRYRLTQIGIAGLSPENEPSPRQMTEAAATAKAHGATTIFFETLVSPKVAQTVADEIGARSAVLDPIEGLTPGSTDDYLSLMRANLATLREALGCS